jgi:type I site-specific restriction endonuclease
VDSAEAEEQIFAGTVYNLEVAGAHTYFANGILVHNCHHFTASTYRRAFEFFDAKRLGVTATPDRADEVALGMILEDVAFTYDIGDGIADGFLVPLVGQSVQLDEIDISGVQDSAGDLSAGQLDDAMFKAVNGIVARSRELEPDRPALYFWPGVRCAEAAAARANALRPGSAEWVAGELRADGADCPVKNAIRRFRNGELKELHNCQVLTEGFDAPPTSLIVLGRPTKSRALIVQKIGRGLRSLPGVIDAFPDKRQECERRAAIANSAKPNAVVLDFVGNAGKHTLVDPVDALAGNHTDEEVEEVKKLIKKGNAADIREALKEAREKLARAAMAAKVRVKSRETQWDPFKILDVDLGDSERYTRRFGFKPPSERQADALKKFGIDDKELEGLSRSAASKLLDSLFKRKADGLASLKQVKQLKKYGIVETAVKADRAKEAMAYLNEQGWGRYGKIDPAKLTEIVYGTRQPGED